MFPDLLVLVDAFNTVILARRTEHIFRITRLFYRITWSPFAAIGRRISSGRWREGFLGVYGPLSLLMLFGLWACALVFGFALLQWSLGAEPGTLPGTLQNDLYLSAAALFTMSTGEEKNAASKVIAVLEGGLGMGSLGMAIAYLPVLYQSFSKRELQISLLDAWAGSPPSAGELLKLSPASAKRLESQLEHWELWAAQVLEIQLSFPMLAYFRSQHANQSWLTALVAIVDTSALIRICSGSDLQRQANLTFAMGTHVLTDIALIFGVNPEPPENRLTEEDYSELVRIASSKPALFRCFVPLVSRLEALPGPI